MLLDRYLPRTEFDSYEDFKENYRCNVPADFNFGFDIVDEWARQEPEKWRWSGAMITERKNAFTFTDISRMSNQAAHFFQAHGVQKRNCRHADPSPSVGILGLCHCAA